MYYLPPMCFGCKNLRNIARQVGAANRCSKYTNRISEEIFYRHGACSFFDALNIELDRPKILRNN